MKNALLKILLVVMTLTLLVYTAIAFRNEGPDLFTVFLSNIRQGNWNGQFNLDFSSYLTLSAVWIMWRNKFSTASIALGLISGIVGILVFAPYLLFLIFKERDDLVKVLIGDRR